jgi:hypothetical protein
MKLWIVFTVVIVAGLAVAQNDATKPPPKAPAKSEPAKPAKTEPAKQPAKAQEKKEPPTKPSTVPRTTPDPFPGIQREFEKNWNWTMRNFNSDMERLRNRSSSSCDNLIATFGNFAWYLTEKAKQSESQAIIESVKQLISEYNETISKCNFEPNLKLLKLIEDEAKKIVDQSAKTLDDNKKNPSLRVCSYPCWRVYAFAFNNVSGSSRTSAWNFWNHKNNPIGNATDSINHALNHVIWSVVPHCEIRNRNNVSKCIEARVS